MELLEIGTYLNYSAYLLWLVAGFGDFALHRRTDLRHTSGVAESATHLVQIGLLGAAIVIAMAFDVGPVMAVVLAMLATTHAFVGYLDSRIAFISRRIVLPIEQHVHSILDMAPVIALGLLLALTWPAAIEVHGSWIPALRQPAFPFSTWVLVIGPAVLLCVIPALIEFRASWVVRFRPAATPDAQAIH